MRGRRKEEEVKSLNIRVDRSHARYIYVYAHLYCVVEWIPLYKNPSFRQNESVTSSTGQNN